MIESRVDEIFDEANPERRLRLARELRTVFENRMKIANSGTVVNMSAEHINHNAKRIIERVFPRRA